MGDSSHPAPGGRTVSSNATARLDSPHPDAFARTPVGPWQVELGVGHQGRVIRERQQRGLETGILVELARIDHCHALSYRPPTPADRLAPPEPLAFASGRLDGLNGE
jgi:hypothetical protein